MIELRTLGTLDLRDSDGHDLTTALTQSKRLALLVYLALASPGGFQRRDTLLGLFWPESDERRARAALRQAVRYLRRALGDAAILSRGEEEVGLAEARVSCDAVEFRRALERGDNARALALYAGDLLPGLHISDAPAFEHWLETERAQLRTAATAAALRLASAAEAVENLEAAADWMNRGVELVPTDEAMVCRLISLLDRTGNRAAAVAAYDAFAERLRLDLDLEPSPETTALIADIRSRPPRPADASNRETAERRASGALPVEPRRVLVTALENRTGERELDRLGRMAADWVAQGLARVPELEVLPPTLAPVSSREAGDMAEGSERDTVRALAEEAGAGTVVSGAYYLDGPDLQFQVRITDAVHGHMVRGPGAVSVRRASPIVGLEDLQQRVTTCLARHLGPDAAHVRRGAEPPSYEAHRAYVEGLEFFTRGDWVGALALFRQSANIAPTYALPRIVCAIAHWNLGELAEAQTIALEAVQLRHTVGPFERAVLDMVLAWLKGDWAGAYEAARRQAELAPGSIPHFGMAEEARRLNRPRETRSILSQLDPTAGELKGFIFYWIELATAHHMLGEHSEELECAARARKLHSDHPITRLLEARALAALGRLDSLHRLLDEVLATPDQREPRAGALLREAALELQAHGYAAAARPLLERSLAWYTDRPPVERNSVANRREFARALYLIGQWQQAEQVFLELAEAAPKNASSVAFHHAHLQGHLDEGYLAVLAARRGDESATEHWCRWLEELERPFLFGSQWLWLAAVAAIRRDQASAVSLLRRALAEGLPYEVFLHSEPHLALLRGYKSFGILLQPRG